MQNSGNEPLPVVMTSAVHNVEDLLGLTTDELTEFLNAVRSMKDAEKRS